MSFPARASLVGGLAVLGGAAVGGAVRVVADGPSPGECAAGAMTVVFAVATVLAAAWDLRGRGLAGRLRAMAFTAAVVWAASAAAGLAAGGNAGALGGALVPAAVATLALGCASLLPTLHMDPRTAGFAGAALACVPSALIFVADPFVEWGSLPGSVSPAGGIPGEPTESSRRPGRARLVLAASPLAAMTSPEGGVGVDWQRMPMLYDGPVQDVPGLSVVGQFYASSPPGPFAWGAVVLCVGTALVGLSRETKIRAADDDGGGSLLT